MASQTKKPAMQSPQPSVAPLLPAPAPATNTIMGLAGGSLFSIVCVLLAMCMCCMCFMGMATMRPRSYGGGYGGYGGGYGGYY